MPSRQAQRRRTRTAIVDAAARLVTSGADPSIDDIAAAADVSRRTVYLYFPTLDQLLLDATVGALSAATFAEITPADEPGTPPVQQAVARVEALISALTGTAAETLPLGRRIIQLTVNPPATHPAVSDDDRTPRRGYRRIEWIEHAVQPLRTAVTEEQLDRLVSGLSVLVGWEAMVVLRDVRGASPAREKDVIRWAATNLVRVIAAEATSGSATTGSATTGSAD